MYMPSLDIFDLLCIGCGPAGLALAAAVEDAKEAKPALSPISLFIEKASTSDWQPEMLLLGTNIRHHHFRDLATPRDPRSRFTFANYLKEHGRIFSFGLFGESVSRIEWSDYILWVASLLRHLIKYRHEVLSVQPLIENNCVTTLLVQALNLETEQLIEWKTRNIVVSTGRVPHIPEIYRAFVGPHVFH